ncbi:MAG: hypothetical protein Q8Q49_06225 [bacterium]|nr:hypothetical protein [bacterium]
MKAPRLSISVSFSKSTLSSIGQFFTDNALLVITFVLSIASVLAFLIYLSNGLGLSYNDARSHLDIGRRVVEGLKPGLAQLGSVWLPLPHLLMVPTIWSDFMWHTGLAGAIQSMVSFVVTGVIVYVFLRKLGVSVLASYFGVFLFASNLNILYLQSTAMTELLLIASMTAGVYKFVRWFQTDNITDLIMSSFFIMLATLNRYDGWFLLMMAGFILGVIVWKKRGFKAAEGTALFFLTLGGIGIVFWVLWNLAIFKDPLYFAFGPYSAHAQQLQLSDAGVLASKHDLPLSSLIYFYALAYNSVVIPLLLSFAGAAVFLFDRGIKGTVRIASLTLFAPLVFNVLALYLGFSVLFVQGLSGNTWFNVRYGAMMMPTVAIFVAYLAYRLKKLGYVLMFIIAIGSLFAFISQDAVTIDDARVGSSQKNVSEVAGWLNQNAKDKEGFILISAASHDAIIFSSGLPMSRFIHEGTGKYWESATASPDRWARWIVMRTNDLNDQTFKLVKQSGALDTYILVDHYPFADIYEIKPEYMDFLQTKPVITNNK